ncbi:hypothetical protein L218DRAFT_1010372 [Marasmius fiardii PR-910]|nr:hypothetical protein L218DRAFT_1010372 [Marasmius fiardii PR-910]
MNNPPANNSASTSGGSSSTPSVNRPPSESRSLDTVRNQSPSANSSSRNSLFSAGSSANHSDVVSETNRVALARGHSSFSELRLSEGGAAPSDTKGSRIEIALSTADLTTDDEMISHYSGSQRSRPSRRSVDIESQLTAYHSELRRQYVLHRLRDHDLLNHGRSEIPPQHIYLMNDGLFYHLSQPRVRQNVCPLEDTEIMRLQTMYPKPGSEMDCNRQPNDSPSGQGSGNNNSAQAGGGGSDEPPPSDDPDGDAGSSDGSVKSEWDENAARENLNVEGDKSQLRHPSEDPSMLNKKVWTYDPTPRSEDEMLKAAFKTFEELITTYLYCKPLKGNTGVQKTLLQSIPKPGYYSGEDNLTFFDTFTHDIVRWMNTADLCGPPVRWSHSKNAYVLTSVDMQRTNTLAAFLKYSARDYYVDAVERIPDDVDAGDPLKGRWTFMQVIAGLYCHFIHEASLTRVVDQYESVVYSKFRGAEGLFSSLKKYAKNLPMPPDLYNFKRRLYLLLLTSMVDDMARIHGVTAEKSSLQTIMETAISLEQSEKAREYYAEACKKLERTRHKQSRSRSKERKNNQNMPRYDKQRDGSPSCLQIVENGRYKVKPHSPPRWDSRPPSYPPRPSCEDRNQHYFNRNDNKNHTFVKTDFAQAKKSAKEQSGIPKPGQIFRMTDEDSQTRLCRIVEVDEGHSASMNVDSHGESNCEEDV